VHLAAFDGQTSNFSGEETMTFRIQPGRVVRCALVGALLSTSVSSYALAASSKQTPNIGCENLKGLDLPNAKVTVAEAITTGTFHPEHVKNAIENLPPFCRVRVVVRPAINVEIWLPLNNWNGKLMGTTPGGTLGSLSWGNTVADLNAPTDGNGISGLANGIQRGYAMMTTDGGHVSADQTWWNDLGRFIDLGYRGAHEMAVKGKTVTQAFYTQKPSRTYFSGCSGSGRVAMMEAQRYPEDFDGIVAGHPGSNWVDLMTAELWATWATTAKPEYNLPAAKVPMIHAAGIAACDADDGVKDGIISNPMLCKFDPVVLQCKGEDGPDCLTEGQVTGLKRIYAGATTPDGRRISYGHEVGSEMGWGSMYTGISDINTQGGNSNRNYIRLSVFNDPNYDLRTFDWNHDYDFMKDKTAHIIDATDPDLSAFKARGGKLISYYGWADGLAPSRYITTYYEEVVAKMGNRAEVENFYRLFMVPGMAHCRGGVGPNKFDMVKALENWSERNIAPDQVVATRLGKDGKPDMTRPLCPWPQVAKHNGVGPINEAKSFYCAAPTTIRN
jgi:feruloyl esterase